MHRRGWLVIAALVVGWIAPFASAQAAAIDFGGPLTVNAADNGVSFNSPAH